MFDRQRDKAGCAVRRVIVVVAILGGIALFACSTPSASVQSVSGTQPTVLDVRSSPGARRLALAAQSQVGKTVIYDAAYVKLKYPAGDVPMDRGVCTDVVVRAFRALGVDLQVEVHKDMAADFKAYPQNWGLPGPDSNIDHRRVPNLRTYFTRKGKVVAASENPADYWPGDLVTWEVSGLPHIGVVSTVIAPGGQRYCIVHNIGAGAQVEDRLFEFKITGHYRPL